ncbi:MAG: prolyl oligopeptidase family serine peptidase [Spirochaetales bacterium]|nr:prolyl oligopeptidase family serine peptidase [Spirochaetales bacterium]
MGQHPQSFEKEITKTLRANCLLYVPEQYLTSQKEWPLILFLHGAGERGNDLSKVEIHGPPKLIAKENKEFPFVIVSPQCPKDGWWSSELQIDVLNALVDDVVSRYRIDRNRIYVTGLSMGGFGTWHLAAAYPDRFAAIAPICGGGNPEDAASMAHLPVWVFHGAKDSTVPLKRSEEMVAALQKSGCKVKFTVYPDAGHDSWSETYSNPDLYEWFLQHSRSCKE